MMELSEATKNVLDAMARAMVERSRHYVASNLRVPFECRSAAVERLASTVEALTVDCTTGQLTVRAAARGFFYGYLSGGQFDLVLCRVDTPAGEIATREPVIQAWVFSQWGLYPLAFDRMPDDAIREEM